MGKSANMRIVLVYSIMMPCHADLAFLAEAWFERLVGWLVACVVQVLQLQSCFLRCHKTLKREQENFKLVGIKTFRAPVPKLFPMLHHKRKKGKTLSWKAS